jgi:hypothetical protein
MTKDPGTAHHVGHYPRFTDRLTINPSFDAHINYDHPNRLRRMEVELFFSIEADNDARNYGDTIDIVVSGRAVHELPLAQRTLSVAEIYDPIYVLIDGDSMLIVPDAVNVVHGVFHSPVNDIIITEHEPGIFAVGSWIRIYAVGTALSPFGTTFNTHATAQVANNGSGLRLSPARVSVDNTYGVAITGVEFQVLEASYDVPAIITLVNNSVSSPIFPTGERLQITVVGDGIAENNHRVWAGAAPQNQTRTAANPEVAGIFISNPYARDIIEFAPVEIPTAGITPPPTGGENGPVIIVPPVTPTRGPVTISQFDNLPGVTGYPIFFREVSGANVGFVSARAFAYLITPTGENAAQRILPDTPMVGLHTIIGEHTDGRTVEVQMATGSSDVTVFYNGQPLPITDIATIAGQRSGVAAGGLTVLNEGGNLFLPFRFIATAFGYDVEMLNAFTILFTPLN